MNISLLLLVVGAASAYYSNSLQKYSVTISGFKLRTDIVYFQKYSQWSRDAIKETAPSEDIAKRNFKDIAETAVSRALEEAFQYFGKSEFQVDVRQDVLRCEGIAIQYINQIIDLVDMTDPIGCGVENGIVVGTCTLLSDCRDRTKWRPVDSKYTYITFEITPKNAPNKWRQFQQNRDYVNRFRSKLSSKLSEKLSGAYVYVS